MGGPWPAGAAKEGGEADGMTAAFSPAGRLPQTSHRSQYGGHMGGRV